MKKLSLLLLLSLLSVVSFGQSTTFNYTGAVQTYTVPCGVTSITVDVAGAKGGDASGYGTGGYGGRVQATINVTTGQILYIYVGQAAATIGCSTTGAGGTNSGGGGQGGDGSSSGCIGAAGGGSSDIRTVSGSTTAALNSRIVVAGGGGGGSWDCGAGYGGAGGGTTGTAGSSACGASSTYAGQPGTASAGGAGASSGPGGAGAFGNGGTGTSGWYGGGGGGGWYGGGGGYEGGGGGGSSYYGNAAVASATTTSGYNSGNGYVVITAPLVANVATSPSSLSFGTIVTSTTSSALTATLTGSTMTSGGSVTITPPANFQVSLDGSTWSSSAITYSYSGTSFTGTTLYVRFTPSASTSYSGNVTITGGGLLCTVNIPVSGTGALACSGAPTGGVTSATVTTGSCTPYASVLSVSGLTVAAGLTYQWQSSPDNSVWSNVSGATSTTYSTTVSANVYYRLAVTCTGSGLTGTSTPINLAYPACPSVNMPVSGSTTACNALFYDSGGPSGNYSDNETRTYTFYPGATGTGSKVSVHFNSFQTESGWDYFYIYNGNSTAGTLLWSGSGSSIPPDFTSTAADGSLTFYFTSDVSVNYAGWSANITNTNPNPITAQPPASSTKCFGGSVPLAVTAAGTNTYQWFDNGTTNSNSGGTLVPGATNSSYSPSAWYVGTHYYYVRVTNACGVGYFSNVAAVTGTAPATPISGSAQACPATTTTLSFAGAAGTWSSSTPAVGTVGLSSGVVTGVSAGTTTITYIVTSTGCGAIQVVTVNLLPNAITGTATACVGATTTLSNTATGGTWISAATSLANVGSSSGIVSGVSAGFVTITYKAPTTCQTTQLVTINPLPALAVSPASATLCPGESATLTANAPLPQFSIMTQDFNSGLNGWVVTSPSGVSASKWQITTSPASGASGDGTPMLESNAQFPTPTETIITSPGFSTAGYASATLKFNQYLLSLATSDANVDVDYSTDNGTTWNNISNQVGAMSGSGSWSSSAPEVNVPLPGGALGQANLKLRWHYNSNYGLYWNIDNITVIAFQAAPTYVWSPAGGSTGLSCTACAASAITPAAVGANAYSVTATTSAGCQATTGAIVNVNPLPAPIVGPATVCVNAPSTFTDANAGGTWSSGNPTLTIDATSGVATGVLAGTAVITYTLPTGCRVVKSLTVNPQPSAITGTYQVCEGQTRALSNPTPGGAWSSAAPGVAFVNSSGVVSGIVNGSADIYYTLVATGCRISANVTVDATPAPIGNNQVCEGLITSLTDANIGGSWSSSNPFVATVDAASGAASGHVTGTSVITYQLPTGCKTTAVLTVNPLPAPITGGQQVCAGGGTIPLSNASSGGTWSSSSAYASVDAAGVVSGITAGVEIITYQLPTTCVSTFNVTVNPLPAAIAGSLQVCPGLTTSLTDPNSGGTWTSGTTGVAAIGVSSGVVTGVAAGSSMVTYQLPTGCIRTAVITVNPLPSAIAGVLQVCEGLATTLGSTPSGGTWTSSAGAVASVGGTGIVSGLASGVTTITYQLPTTCSITADVTVNPIPDAIAGSSQVCEASSVALFSSTPGGSWFSGNASTATVNSLGSVTGVAPGATMITYQLPTSCVSTYGITVNPRPAPIGGASQVCEGLTTNMTDGTPSGVWSSSSSSIASVDAAGVVTGQGAGAATITYALPTTCMRTKSLVVNPQPSAIAGSIQVCEATSGPLSNTIAGGTWISNATGIANVGFTSGVVSGMAQGNAVVTYTLPTGCRTSTVVTVHPKPAPITGISAICANSTATLGDLDAGGVWSSSVPALASVDPSTGVVTGVAMGTAIITYTLPTTCKATAVATVNPLPAPIAGLGMACEGTTALYTNGSPGGTWTGSSSIAAIDAGTGSINALTAGVAQVTYTLPTGCARTREFTVNPTPAAIAGTLHVCESGTTSLSNTTNGGVWSSNSVTTAGINATGVVSGLAAGVTSVTYMLPTGCNATAFVTVNQLPAAIDGAPAVCEGKTTTLSDMMPGGTWTTNSTLVAAADAATGSITGVLAGSALVTYTLPSGCIATRSITVNPTPVAITGASQVCQGSTIPMGNATSGGVWTSSNTVVAGIDLISGTLSGFAAGPVTVSYTLLTGCGTSAIVTVNPLPSPVSGSLNVCGGQTTTLSTATTGGSWVASDTLVATVTSSGIVTGAAAGNVNIGYVLSTGCARNSIVTVSAQPSVFNVTGGGNYCAGGPGVHVGLDGSSAGVSYHLYSGTTPVGIVSGLSGLPVDFGLITPPGTYYVIARNAATGCTRNMTGVANVTVGALVTPAVAVTGSDVTCDGVAATYTSVSVNGGSAPSYVWKVNGITQPGATGDIFSFTPANGDVITSTMTSNAACAAPLIATSSKTITVKPNVMPVANVTADPGLVVCQGSAATFTVADLYGGTAPTYTWLKNSAPAGSGTTFTYTPANGDHIQVKMTSNYGCRLADEVTSSMITMTTNPIYIPAVTIGINPGNHIQPGANVTLTANVASAGPEPVYQWYINSLAIPSATNATFTYSLFSDGDSVSCQVTGTGLCGMSVFNSVIMHVGPSGVAITGSGVSDVRLVPNPNKGIFTVKGTLTTTNDEEVMLEVTNMLGQVVYRQGVTAKNGLVDQQVQLSNALANGMYMLNLKTSADNKVFHFVLEQ